MQGEKTGRLVTLGGVLRAAALCLGLTIAGHLLAHFVCSLHPFDCPKWWPLGEFQRRVPSSVDVLFAGLVVLAVEISRRRLKREDGPLVPSLGAVVIVLLSTATQGIPRGFERPIDGLLDGGVGVQYFHETARFSSVADVLARWNALQASLGTHARTHPPGAVLLAEVLPHPTLLGIAWLLVATFVASIALHRLLLHLFGDRGLASTGVLLFATLPAVQIYFGATLDALLAAVLLLGIATHVSKSSFASAVGTGLLFAVAALLSFAAWIAVPVLFAVELVEHRTVKRSAIALFVALATVAALRAFGYDYLESFRTASQVENPDGFRLLSDPVDYFGTRMEDVAEILFFLGPAVLLAAFRSRGSSAPLPRALVSTGFASLLLAFLTGAFRTGETARACLFVTPLFLIPTLARLRTEPDPGSRDLLLRCTLGFGLLMQLFGDWFW